RACLGELIQIDGSDHRWFEERAPACTLLVYVFVGWRHLQHHDIDPQSAIADQPRKLRIMHWQNVEHPGTRKRAIRSASAVCEEVERVGVFGEQHVCETDTEKDTNPLQTIALSDQRAHQRHGFGVRLTPHHGIAGTDEHGKIQATAVRTAIVRATPNHMCHVDHVRRAGNTAGPTGNSGARLPWNDFMPSRISASPMMRNTSFTWQSNARLEYVTETDASCLLSDMIFPFHVWLTERRGDYAGRLHRQAHRDSIERDRCYRKT
ncbi:hypothetical protein ACVK00_006711, partial [Burkholderia sp. PvR073]